MPDPDPNSRFTVPEFIEPANDFAMGPAARNPAPAAPGGLAAGLAGLAGLSIGGLSLQDLLTRVAEFAAQAIPGAHGAGLTLLKWNRPDTVVFSAPFVERVDTIQYRLGEGPCVTAASTKRPCDRAPSRRTTGGHDSGPGPEDWVCTACCPCH
jgi:hypothetical protein